MENGSCTPNLRMVGPTNLETDLYSSSLEVELALFVTGKTDKPFREPSVTVGLLVYG
jgi:hypothetical protein